MALTPAERMRRYRAKKMGGKTADGKNINKSAKLYLDEETQMLIDLLKNVAQNENLEQLFKRALFALSQQSFSLGMWSALAEEEHKTKPQAQSAGNTMNQLHGKILLLESEYITPLKETVRYLQKKKLSLQQQAERLKQQNHKLKKTALNFRRQRDQAWQQLQLESHPEILSDALQSALPSYCYIPALGKTRTQQRQRFVFWLQAQRRVPYPWHEIADALNQAGIATPSGKNKWQAENLQRLLKHHKDNR